MFNQPLLSYADPLSEDESDALPPIDDFRYSEEQLLSQDDPLSPLEVSDPSLQYFEGSQAVVIDVLYALSRRKSNKLDDVAPVTVYFSDLAVMTEENLEPIFRQHFLEVVEQQGKRLHPDSIPQVSVEYGNQFKKMTASWIQGKIQQYRNNEQQQVAFLVRVSVENVSADQYATFTQTIVTAQRRSIVDSFFRFVQSSF
ncbi:hypothetical protein GEMRC1_001797 [Eukaryota sp. GEM-RC1]